MRAGQRHRQRDRHEAGLHRAENPDDVFEALRSEDRHAITRRSAGRQFRGNNLRAPVDLKPRQCLGIARRIQFVVDERVRARIRLSPGPFPQHSGNERMDEKTINNIQSEDPIKIREKKKGTAVKEAKEVTIEKILTKRGKRNRKKEKGKIEDKRERMRR